MKTAELIVQANTSEGEKRIAAYQLVEYLERLGVEVIFGLCGHTVIAFLDALSTSSIKFISTRHEQVAAHAADGYARASGKPGVLMTHLGPGLTNAATGVANAALDSIPMVVIAGDIPSHYFGRHPHQEVNLHMDADQYEIYRPFCKRHLFLDRILNEEVYQVPRVFPTPETDPAAAMTEKLLPSCWQKRSRSAWSEGLLIIPLLRLRRWRRPDA